MAPVQDMGVIGILDISVKMTSDFDAAIARRRVSESKNSSSRYKYIHEKPIYFVDKYLIQTKYISHKALIILTYDTGVTPVLPCQGFARTSN